MRNVRVFAQWTVKELPETFDEFYISQGADDDSQGDGFFIEDPGAVLTVHRIPGGYRVRLEAPDQGVTKSPDYWLSPACVNDTEADDFGVIKPNNTTKETR